MRQVALASASWASAFSLLLLEQTDWILCRHAEPANAAAAAAVSTASGGQAVGASPAAAVRMCSKAVWNAARREDPRNSCGLNFLCLAELRALQQLSLSLSLGPEWTGQPRNAAWLAHL